MQSARLARLAALNQFTLAASSTTMETEILSMAVETIAAVFPFDGAVALIHAEGDLAVVANWSKDGELSIDESLDENAIASMYLGDDSSDLDIEHDGAQSMVMFRLPSIGRRPDLLMCRVQTSPGDAAGEREFLDQCRQHLGAALANARAHTDLERRVDLRTQELASVNAELSHRLGELKVAQSALVEASRKAGVAEVVTNVLHNVGNVLNSVNVSVKMLTGRMRTSRADGVDKAMGLLTAQPDRAAFLAHDPRGERLVAYLIALGGALIAERDGALGELGELARSVAHIKNIVDAQQASARSARVLETVVLADLVEEAVRLTSPVSDAALTLTLDLDGPADCHVDRHKLLQILVNLLSNARQAVRLEPAAAVRVRCTAVDDERLSIAVEDNGVGIPAENLVRVFQHGFTTRSDGHGFGLHTCACAAVELGGQLSVHSDGVGRGARFTLLLPRRSNP